MLNLIAPHPAQDTRSAAVTRLSAPTGVILADHLSGHAARADHGDTGPHGRHGQPRALRCWPARARRRRAPAARQPGRTSKFPAVRSGRGVWSWLRTKIQPSAITALPGRVGLRVAGPGAEAGSTNSPGSLDAAAAAPAAGAVPGRLRR